MQVWEIALWVVLLPLGFGVIVTILLIIGRGIGNGLLGWGQSRDAQVAAKWELLADELGDEDD